MQKGKIILACLVIGIAVAGTLLFEIGFHGERHSILGLTVFIMGVLVFFGSLRTDPNSTLREPIALTLLVTYLYMMPSLIFVGPPAEPSSVADAFIQSFTAMVGVAIAFYFGGDAAVKIARIRAGRNDPSENDGNQSES